MNNHSLYNEEEVEAEIWESEDENEVEDDVRDDTVAIKFVKLMCVFLLSWQNNFRIPDIAINSLLKFLAMVFHDFKEIVTADNLQEIAKNFPDNLQKARTISHINRDNFQK